MGLNYLKTSYALTQLVIHFPRTANGNPLQYQEHYRTSFANRVFPSLLLPLVHCDNGLTHTQKKINYRKISAKNIIRKI